MTVHIIDAAENCRPSLDSMWNAGVRGVIRYDCRLVHGRWKEASNEEVRAILDRGMSIAFVNEGIGSRLSAFDFQTGYDDACYSLGRAHYRKQSPKSAIYYAVDFDASYASIHSDIVPYFEGVRKAHNENTTHWRVGCYGSGLCLSELEAKHLIDLRWVTCSSGFQGSRAYIAADKEDLWQYACDREFFGVSADYNVQPAHKDDYGQWFKAPLPPLPPEPSQWNPAWGPSVGKASWYNDSTNADMTPVHNATDLSCAHRAPMPFGTKLRITRVDDGTVVENVVCHDRGPFVSGRIIDLRPHVADLLHMKDDGVITVKLEVMP